jgi:hypothetical protein
MADGFYPLHAVRCCGALGWNAELVEIPWNHDTRYTFDMLPGRRLDDPTEPLVTSAEVRCVRESSLGPM